MKKVEFIESYIHRDDGDYQWNDNHGKLVRCGDCRHKDDCEIAYDRGENGDWFCANGEAREDAQ